MPISKPYAEQQERIGYQTAKLGRFTGFSTAYLETSLETGEERVVGVFKGERTFFQKYANSRRKMIYEGFVEKDSVIYYTVVPVTVEARTRQARFVSFAAPTVWQRITDT